MTAAAGTLPALPQAAAVLRRARSENFTVAGRVLPLALREHLLAVYGFARLVDDTADESPGDRLALLDRLEIDVDRIFLGREPSHPLMRRIAATVRRFAIPAEPLRALIEANRRDQRQAYYQTFEDLLGYCELSANPVGRLVLQVFETATPVRCRLSDAICTGLQLSEHSQDVAEDFARGRVYLPAADLRRLGCTHADLAGARSNAPMRALIAFEVARAREYLDLGAPLIVTLRGRAGLAVAGFVAGGRAALGTIEDAGFDVLGGAPCATEVRRLAALATTLREAGRRRDR